MAEGIRDAQDLLQRVSIMSQYKFPINLGRGEALRFAVGTPDGPRSTSWRIWTGRNADDVYVAPRTVASMVKMSLHQSGRWQYGFTDSPKARPWVENRESRHIDTWQRPPEFGPGVTRGCAIRFPHSELRVWPEGHTVSRKVAFVPAPRPGQYVQVEVLLMRATDPPATLDIDLGLLVAHLELASDMGGVGVVARLLPLSALALEAMQMVRQAMLHSMGQKPHAQKRFDAAGLVRFVSFGEEETAPD